MVYLNSRDMQSSRGEEVSDMAKVLSRYVDCIMMRTRRRHRIREMAAHATVPVINGLTDISHPCQLMADVLTFEEHRGPIAGQTVAWIGDGNNVAQSFIQAARGWASSCAWPARRSLRPPQTLLDWARAEGAEIVLTDDPAEAVQGARCVVTDAWVSMRQETRCQHRTATTCWRPTR